MKPLKNASPVIQTKALSLKYLVIAVASMLAVSVAQADVANKKIGDLEIYKAAEGGNIVITMMLDTSGSMTANQVGAAACDVPAGVSKSYSTSKPTFDESNTTPSYRRYYCTTNADTRYYFSSFQPSKKGSTTTWYRCGDSSGAGSPTTSSCDTVISQPSTTDYQTTSSGNTTYYYKTGKVYDRLTLLKDALFALMDSNDLDSKKVKIGIGQYSSQSNSDNSISFIRPGYANADGNTGKIVVPAEFLDAAQRTKIKTAVADAGGGNGTPTANAYAEVGAYMLGTKTSGTNSGFSKSVTSSKSGSTYISPLASTTTATCDGRGIYFLTDGEPSASTSHVALMKSALGKSVSLPTDTLPTTGGMNYVGAFARALRDAKQNPLGTNGEILTAVVGFGSDFDVDKEADARLPETDRVIRTLSYEDSKGKTQTADFYNCDKITTNSNAKNACNWGAKSHPELPSSVGGFGEGGFYSAQSTEDIVNSVTTFVKDLESPFSRYGV